jgi:hypothetical protein
MYVIGEGRESCGKVGRTKKGSEGMYMLKITDLVGNGTLIGRVESLVRVVLSLLVTGSTLRLLVSLSNISSSGVSFVLRLGRHNVKCWV